MGKIGIIGYRGRVGSSFLGVGEPVECDITNKESIRNATTGYDIIINCAAYTDVDGAERERLKAYAINSFGPQNIADVFPGHLVHLSTDYIFDGISGPYDENVIASPISAYGFSKYFGEVGLRPFMERVLIVRTTVIYGGSRPNFVSSIASELLKGNKVKAPKYLYGNPTFTGHLANGIMDCIERNLTGIINISGTTLISRYQLAREIALFIGKDPNNVISSFAWGDAKRPENAGLVLDKAEKLGIRLYTLWEGLHADAEEKSNPIPTNVVM